MNKIRRGNREGSRLFGYLMVVPATLLLVVVSIIPLLDGVYLAFTNTNLNTGADAWVGIQNFVEIFQASKFYQVFGFTILYAFAVVLFSYILGMLIALLLNQDIRFRGVFRAIILAPWVVPPVVATITWSWLLTDKVGLINTVLQNIGMIQEPIYFLSDLTLVKGTVIAFGVWKSYPFMMITLLAGMQSIDGVLYEAAKIDGAGKVKAFFHITMPMMKNVSFVCTILMFIWTINNFENIYLMTQGGPLDSTMILSILTYNSAFFRGQMGYASAINMVMLVFLTILSMIYLKALNQKA